MAALNDEVRAEIKRQLVAKPAAPSAAEARTYKYKQYASDALGVNPCQIAEATANLRAHGCTADFDTSGRLVVTSEKQFRTAAKASGMWDGRDGYQVKDSRGGHICTGRDSARAREQFRRAVMSGQFD